MGVPPVRTWFAFLYQPVSLARLSLNPLSQETVGAPRGDAGFKWLIRLGRCDPPGDSSSAGLVPAAGSASPLGLRVLAGSGRCAPW